MRTRGRIGGRLLAAIAAALLALVLILFGAAQLFLPGIAADHISARIGRYGTVDSVKVRAWPAVKLLWGSADSVQVRARRLRLSPQQTAALLWEAHGTTRVDLTAASLQVGPLQLREARLSKRGGALHAVASISAASVAAALPKGVSLQLLQSEGGAVVARASGGLFGASTSLRVLAGARGGRLVAHPIEGALQDVQLTLFADRHVSVQGVGASAQAGGRPGYWLTMDASLR